jgi:hypothetical protein
VNVAHTADVPALIDVTRQRTRLYAPGGAIGLSLVLVLAAPFLISNDFAVAALVSFGVGSLSLFASVLYLMRAIRCPTCHLALLQHAFAEVPYGRWLSWLLEAKECPKCGYPSKKLVTSA